MMTKLLRFLVTGDGFDYFTDDLTDALEHARKWDGVIYERRQKQTANPPATIYQEAHELAESLYASGDLSIDQAGPILNALEMAGRNA